MLSELERCHEGPGTGWADSDGIVAKATFEGGLDTGGLTRKVSREGRQGTGIRFEGRRLEAEGGQLRYIGRWSPQLVGGSGESVLKLGSWTLRGAGIEAWKGGHTVGAWGRQSSLPSQWGIGWERAEPGGCRATGADFATQAGAAGELAGVGAWEAGCGESVPWDQERLNHALGGKRHGASA